MGKKRERSCDCLLALLISLQQRHRAQLSHRLLGPSHVRLYQEGPRCAAGASLALPRSTVDPLPSSLIHLLCCGSCQIPALLSIKKKPGCQANGGEGSDLPELSMELHGVWEAFFVFQEHRVVTTIEVDPMELRALTTISLTPRTRFKAFIEWWDPKRIHGLM